MKRTLTDDAGTYKIVVANFEAAEHHFILFSVLLYASGLLMLTRPEAEALRNTIDEALTEMSDGK